MSNGVVYVLSGTRTAYLIRLGWQFALMILRLFCVRFAFVLRSFCVRFAFVLRSFLTAPGLLQTSL